MLQVKIKSLKYMVIVAMEWKDHIVRSGEFDNPSGHQNPHSMPVESYTIKSDPVKVGAFILSKGKVQYHNNVNKSSFLLMKKPNRINLEI